MSELEALSWPAARVGDAIQELARRSRVPLRTADAPAAPAVLDAEGMAAWIESTCTWLELEAEPLAIAVTDLHASLANAAPALVRLPSGRVVAVTSAAPRVLRVVDEARNVRSLSTDVLVDALLPPASATRAVDSVLEAGQVPSARRARARRVLVQTMLASHRITGLWLLRLPPAGRFAAQLRRAKIAPRVAMLLGAYALAMLLVALGFSLMGQAALDGRIDFGWLAAWAAVIATQVPLGIYVDWAAAQIAIDFGAILKQRLFAGALRLDGDAVRSAGAGELLGRALESEVIEAAGLTGAFSTLTACLELAFALVVLLLGTYGLATAGVLALFTALSALGAIGFVRRRRDLTEARVAMTHDLVERMVGHRTRLAQDVPARWHEGEDAALHLYLERTRALDASNARLTTLAPKLWLLAALGVLAIAFVRGAESQASLAIALGGILMGERALRHLTQGAVSLGSAWVAWETVGPLFRAASRPEPAPTPEVGFASRAPSREDDVVEMREVYFRHRAAGEPVLAGASLRLAKGDRVLLEGRSGSGKSTLASILCGLREAQSGLVLASGLDRKMVGQGGWRRRVASAPQFHENHVISSSLAFNLLLGRRWPPRPEDLEEAQTICTELGLAPLIERMPSGMQQTIGETGWQLSHGEMSRVFIARSLLQDPDVVVLDESVAALDPETLSTVLGTAMRRARTLLVIAHP